MNKIDLGASLTRDRWGEFFDRFSDDYSGRHIVITIIDSEFGNRELIQNAPLMAIIYDRPGKGDNLAIEVGKDQVTYAHTINSPTEVLPKRAPDGKITAIQVSDAAGTQTLIKLQAS